MTDELRPLGRRTFLRGSLATAVLFSTGTLSACASSGGGDSEAEQGDVSDANPLGVPKGKDIEAVIFDGGFGTDYVKFAGDLVTKTHGGKLKLNATTEIQQQMQPRFAGGTPPDLLLNAGADKIAWTQLIDKAEDLTEIVDGNNLEGKKIRDTLYPKALDPMIFEDKLVGINYVMVVYASWYSQTLFDEKGWQPPKTWDEALELGKDAKADGKHLYLWGKEAANYYMTMVLDSAIKEGGDEVRVALGNLEPKSWSHDAVQGAFEGLKKVVDAGYVKPGGAGTQFTAAQAQWSLKEQALLYPSGSWIENEMKKQTKKGFKMTGAPQPALSDKPAFGPESIHAESLEGYVVPSQAKNPAAGKEMLRSLLSKEAAENFSKEQLALSIVDGVVPDDGYGSTALQAQVKMMKASGEKSFVYNFYDLYGFGDESNVVFNSFLAGDMSVKDATAQLQKFADKVREDDSIKKTKVK